MDFEKFMDDTRTQDAVARNIEIIGEAAKGLSERCMALHADIPWRSVAGMRDRLIHGYFGVNWDVVWSVVQDDLPVLIGSLRGNLSDP